MDTTRIKDESLEKISKSLNNYWGSEQIQILHNTVAKGTSTMELSYFLNFAKSIDLNPFNKEIWCYKDNKNNLIIFAGRDGFLKKAQQNKDFAGIRSCEIKANDEFMVDVANNKITHNIKNLKDRGAITGAYAIVFRKGGEPTVSIVEFVRYNKNHNTWVSHPEDMIKKVAESKALKLAFGISGLQIEDDFDIKNGIAHPLVEGEVVKTKKKLTDKDFERFCSQSDSYIERFKDSIEFTEEQTKLLNVRLSQ